MPPASLASDERVDAEPDPSPLSLASAVERKLFDEEPSDEPEEQSDPMEDDSSVDEVIVALALSPAETRPSPNGRRKRASWTVQRTQRISSGRLFAKSSGQPRWQGLRPGADNTAADAADADAPSVEDAGGPSSVGTTAAGPRSVWRNLFANGACRRRRRRPAHSKKR
jgi:hypothetical protein